MAKNRAQVSLIFPRDDVFNDLVLPLKRERRFTDLVQKLVERYYDSEELRMLVDADEIEVSENTPSQQDIYTRINESIAAMDFLVQEGRNTVEDGADVFQTILEGGKKAGVFKESGDELDEEVSFVNPDLMQVKQIGVSEEIPQNSKEPSENDRVTKLENELSEMKEMLSNLQSMIQGGFIQQQSQGNENSVVSKNLDVNSNSDSGSGSNSSSLMDSEMDIEIDLDDSEVAHVPAEDSRASLTSLLSSL